MDIVIPIGNGSHWNDNELRYSLRSLVRYGKNIGNIIIVGQKPEWIQNVIHIPNENPTNRNHEHNIYENILLACKSDLVKENFLGWQDDYFLLSLIDCDNYPFYHNGLLEKGVKSRVRFDGYAMGLDNSRKYLAAKGLETYNYDTHCPIVYNKQAFIDTVGSLDWETDNGFVIKSIYANSLRVIGHHLGDLKINSCRHRIQLDAQLKGRHIFSLSDKGLTDVMKKFLRETYPHKSIYEI